MLRCLGPRDVRTTQIYIQILGRGSLAIKSPLIPILLGLKIDKASILCSITSTLFSHIN